MGPVHHAVISISTGLYLGGSVTLPGLSVHQIVKMILKNITHAAVEDVIHLNRNLFCADRGYMHAVTNDILQYGGQLLGTQKRIPGNAMIDENAAKGYLRKPGPTVKIISNEGPKCDYWAVKEVKTGCKNTICKWHQPLYIFHNSKVEICVAIKTFNKFKFMGLS